MHNIEIADAFFPATNDQIVSQSTIGEILAQTAAEHGEKIALTEVTQMGVPARQWSYRELYNESFTLARALSSRFVKGEHIVLWAPNTPEWVLMEYAGALAGLVIITANPALQENELRYILEQSDAIGLFLVSEFRGNRMTEIATQAIKGNHAIREVTDLDDRAALFRNKTNEINLPEVKPYDAAQIQYTSGTTGHPKGAVLSHSGLVNNAKFYALRCGVQPTSTWVNIMPMFHTSGCGMVTLGCLNSSCRMVLVSLFDAGNVLDLIEQFDADIILGVPTMVLA